MFLCASPRLLTTGVLNILCGDLQATPDELVSTGWLQASNLELLTRGCPPTCSLGTMRTIDHVAVSRPSIKRYYSYVMLYRCVRTTCDYKEYLIGIKYYSGLFLRNVVILKKKEKKQNKRKQKAQVLGTQNQASLIFFF